MTRPLTELDQEARRSVLRQLLSAAKAWSALEERYGLEGRHIEAEGAHKHSVWVLRAYAVEFDNPIPAGLEHPHHTPIPGCPRCEP
jgi:hypothetical protein